MTKREREKVKKAIDLLFKDHENGFDRAMRILMPMVGMRRAIWDGLKDAKAVPLTEIAKRPDSLFEAPDGSGRA